MHSSSYKREFFWWHASCVCLSWQIILVFGNFPYTFWTGYSTVFLFHLLVGHLFFATHLVCVKDVFRDSKTMQSWAIKWSHTFYGCSLLTRDRTEISLIIQNRKSCNTVKFFLCCTTSKTKVMVHSNFYTLMYVNCKYGLRYWHFFGNVLC